MTLIKNCILIFCFLISFYANSNVERTFKIDRDIFVELQEYSDSFSKNSKNVCTSISDVTLYKLAEDNVKWENTKENDPNPLIALIGKTINAIVSENLRALNKVNSVEYKENSDKYNDEILPFFEQLRVIKIKEILGYIKYGKGLVFITKVEYKGESLYPRFLFSLDSESNYKFEPGGFSGRFNYCIGEVINGYIGEINT